ncbi:MAG: ABC transporter ATP-binding protein [Bacteroidaceae bacterium]|nr:ABC transporter ATP-binding protein [Bacteroidaceae bacterium]
MIILEHLTVGYHCRRNDRIVASDLNASADDGTLTCLVGVNGIGKSTLLRTIAGFQNPISGNVLAGSSALEHVKPVHMMTQSERSRLIGVVLTGFTGQTNLTVQEVVCMGRSPYTGLMGTLSNDDETAVENAMKLTGTDFLASRCFDDLSDGERQKVMIAKALAQETPVIILDEPSAFLDYPSKEDMMRLLLRLSHEEGRTILLSSHDLDIVRRFSDSFWIMERQESGTAIRTDRSIC